MVRGTRYHGKNARNLQRAPVLPVTACARVPTQGDAAGSGASLPPLSASSQSDPPPGGGVRWKWGGGRLQWPEMAATSSGGSASAAAGYSSASVLSALFVSLRPGQWVKNLVLPLPFLFGSALSHASGWILAAEGFVVFC